MAHDPNTSSNSASGDVGIDQAQIDALLNGAQTGVATEDFASSGGNEISQADVDALLRGISHEAGGEAPSPAEPDSRLDSLGRPYDDAAAMMQAAIEEERAQRAAPAAAARPGPGVPSFVPSEFAALSISETEAKRVSMLNDVQLRVRVELGRTRMLVEDVLKLGDGAVVELDKIAGDPVDIYVNDRLLARGEVLVLNDCFCVRVSEVITPDPHRIAS